MHPSVRGIGKPSRQRRRSSVQIVGPENSLDQVIRRDSLTDNHELLLYKVLTKLKDFEAGGERSERQREIKCEWQQVAMIADRLAFYLYSLLTVVLWIVIFCLFPWRNTSI